MLQALYRQALLPLGNERPRLGQVSVHRRGAWRLGDADGGGALS